MKFLAFALIAVVLTGCSGSYTCEQPSLYEPIEHCDDCKWKSE